MLLLASYLVTFALRARHINRALLKATDDEGEVAVDKK